MNKLPSYFLLLACFALTAIVTGLLAQEKMIWQPAAVTASVSLAIGLGAVPALKNYRYTAWIIAAVVAAMIYPSAFTNWGGLDLRNKWLILIIIQLVMFGMGIQMSFNDFLLQ